MIEAVALADDSIKSNYDFETLEGLRNQAKAIVAHALDSDTIPGIYAMEIDRMPTYQDVYKFLTPITQPGIGITTSANRILSFDPAVQREYALGSLGNTDLDLSRVQLGIDAAKIGDSVVSFITDEEKSYDEIKDDEIVLSHTDFNNLKKKLGVGNGDSSDFARLCIYIFGMKQGQKYRVRGSYKQYAYVVEIKDGKIECTPDLNGKDSDLLPVLRKGDNGEFEINMLSLSEMPDQVIPETAEAQSALDEFPVGNWKNTIRIEKGTVFFEELGFGVLLFDTHVQLKEEIQKTVMDKFDWNEIEKYLVEKGLSRSDRIKFYTEVLLLSEKGEYKTASENKGYQECFKFHNGKLHFYTDMDNDTSLPMRKKVTI